MQYERTYLDKCCTIVRGSKLNTGLNPVSDLLYGRNLSRLLIHFDHDKIKNMVNELIYPDVSKLRHRLVMKNSASIDMSELHKAYGSQIDAAEKLRASSFDLIFFLLPEDWDGGKGFDYTKNGFNAEFYNDGVYLKENRTTENGANWFKPRNGYTWENEPEFEKTTDEQLTFHIKSDRKIIPSTGCTVTFTYFCGCNGNYNNNGLEFNIMANMQDNPVVIGTPIYYAKNGQICHTDEEIAKYCLYIKVTAEIPRNDMDIQRRMSFKLSYTINGKTYKSNPYRIFQQKMGDYVYPVTEDGIYSTKTLEEELSRYHSGMQSVIIGMQHFDVGCEDIDIDITDTFNKFITGDLENHGIGIAYAPVFEYDDSSKENYLGILTNRTNTFFEPYVETIYEDEIKDDRQNFVLGRKNRLYLYANVGGDLVNLDQLPICSINGQEYEARQATKGMYYIEITLPKDTFNAPTMLYDTWSNLFYQGQELDPVEMDFTTYPARSFFSIGSQLPDKNAYTPTVYGIKDNEEIKRFDLRKVVLLMRKDYDMNTLATIDDVEARLYVKDGTAELDVIPFVKCDRAFTVTYMMIDTSILIPNTYYMDVRVKYGMEMIVHHQVLKFKIVDDENNKYA